MYYHETFDSLIQDFLKKSAEQTSSIQGVKPADSTKKESYAKIIEDITLKRGRGLFYPYVSSGLGRGPFIQLLDGSVKMDLIGGIGPHILGHGHPELLKSSLLASLESTIMQGHLQMSGIYQKTLNKLVEVASRRSSLEHAWFCPSGSMANENALKVIRQKRNKARYILAFDNAFAGRTTMMTEITANPKVKEGLPEYNEVLRVPFSPENTEKSLEALKKHWEDKQDQIACFIMELMPGDGGCLRAPREFFLSLCEFCKEKGIAIWFDEVQTFARSGEFFAFEKLDLGEFVDVCTIGKSLQTAATLWTKNYNPKPGLVSGTFAGSTSSFYAALAILELLDQGYMGEQGRIEQIHQEWMAGLQELEKQNLISKTQGWGLMVGTQVLDGNSQLVNRLLQLLFEKGLICFSCGADNQKRLRFLLPAILDTKTIQEALKILKESLLEIKNL